MSIELITGLAMVLLMMGTILTKYVSTVLLVRYRRQLLATEAELREVRGHLKAAQNEVTVAKSNEKTLSGKKERLEKQLPLLRKELDSLQK